MVFEKLYSNFMAPVVMTSMLLTGCSHLTASEKSDWEMVRWESIYQSQNCTFDAPQLMLLNADEGQSVLQEQTQRQLKLSMTAPQPPQEFSADSNLLVIAMGQKPSGGYALSTQQIRSNGSTISVSLEWITPSQGDFVTSALTSPCQLLLIPNNLIEQGLSSNDIQLVTANGQIITLN